MQRLLAGDHASHLCGEPACVNPDHLVVEDKITNESRKSCQKNFSFGLITIGDKRLRVEVGADRCYHAVKCVRRFVDLFAVEETPGGAVAGE